MRSSMEADAVCVRLKEESLTLKPAWVKVETGDQCDYRPSRSASPGIARST